ncbi:LysR family transcriptional regulator [Chitinimonas sp.]|uniref:LysR family transcriptional regulator n=1 Tax=Chitinimonas sp. TaxID=1934313 RepID=UPI002F938A25
MNITFQQLKAFLAVAQHRHFSRAAEALALTQPAVSRSVRQLEAELGFKLLDRTTREVVLTEAGKRVAASVGRSLSELEQALFDSLHLNEGLRGRVRIATSPTISANLMPQCIVQCGQQYPEIEIALHDQVQRLVLAGVQGGEVDFGVIIEPMAPSELECEPILVEPFLLVCAADHPLARRATVDWQALSGEALVLLDYASGSRPLIDRALAAQGVQYRVAQEVGHSTTAFKMVAAGVGVSVLPALALPLPDHEALVARPLVPAVNRTVMLVKRKNRSLSAAAETVWRLIRERAAEFERARGR